MNQKSRWTEFLLPIGIVACLLVIFVPLPPGVMDVLLAGNISLAVIILLTTLYVRRPIEMSVFPSLLLATTLFRLALNVGTTRLILTGGASQGDQAAGQVIQSFGQFVAGDQIAIGLVIFAIIVIIQFVVITKGATRISEVAARFALDGMPGRQMAIDADLNAGNIDSETARKRREEIGINADFYGAMDGASKFVRGDAIAGILITLVNIVGGLVVGLMAGMTISEAASVFTKLTIGDGLASQLPALLISMAAAMLVTRGTRKTNLPKESLQQVFSQPAVLAITAGFLLVMVFTELPKIPLLVMAAGCLIGARLLFQKQRDAVSRSSKKPATSHELTISKLLGNDVLEMELGIELIRLADPNQGGDLLPQVTAVRKELAQDLGVILPKIRIRDNLQLPPQQYRILVQGNPVEIGTIYPDFLFALDQGNASAPINGAIATETTESGQGFWVDPAAMEAAQASGYRVLRPTAALVERLSGIAFQQAPRLLTRDAVNELLDETRKSAPAVVEELVPDLLTVPDIQRVLRQLVAERVSIRPMGLILEAMADCAPRSKLTHDLIETVRKRIGPQITASLLGNHDVVSAFTISDALQHQIRTGQVFQDDDIRLEIPTATLEAMADALRRGAETMTAKNLKPVLVVSQDIRAAVHKIATAVELDMHVLGTEEIPPGVIEVLGEISSEQPPAGANAA
ncbi:MAG: flagellar biosynthesis protein FlhA [Mariniblastus sp.]|nr:flagellar biosynthesis protein FlhA [Mariniblastus sp.]